MTRPIQVLGQLTRPLLRYLDGESIEHPEFRERAAAAQAEPRIDIERWWGLLEELATLGPRPALGIHIGRYCKLEDSGVLGYLAASCNVLGEAFYKLQRFQPLLHNHSYLRATVQQSGLYFTWDAQGGRSPIISNDVWISGLITVSQSMVGDNPVPPEYVELPLIPVELKSEYERLLGCPVRITEDVLAMKVSNECLQQPIDTRNAHLRRILEQQAESLLATVPHPDAFLQTVQENMLEGIETGQLSVDWLARQMGISQRSLYRAFAGRGRHYQELLDGLREQLATRYLASSELGLAEISLLLGYSEQSVFSRSFKKWTGQTPLSYRRNHSASA